MQDIMLDGADNVRDFGGTVNREGRVIRPGRLIRSNHLNALTEADVNLLSVEYHLRGVIDLRTDAEVRERPDASVPGAEWIHLPLFEERAVGITHEKMTDLSMIAGSMPDMASLYRLIVTDSFSTAQLGRVMQVIMEIETGAVLWHCTEGKDRCGVVSALVLELLNVDRETIFEDYLATNRASTKRADAYEKEVLKRTGDETMARNVRNLFLADRSYLQAAFDAVEEAYGSMERFFEYELGISGEKRAKFQEKCLA